MVDEETTPLIDRPRELRTEPYMPERKRVLLVVVGGPLQGTSFPISKPRVLLGRLEPEGQSTADVVIDDPKVSRTHCTLEIHGTTAFLVDLDSANGTFVDGKKIAVCELTHFSDFRIGETTLLLTIM